MYTQIMGFNHDQGIPEIFLGFLLFLSKSTLFNYPKFIVESIHEQFGNFSSLTTFLYQSYIMYPILDKFSVHFENLLDPQDPVSHRTSFVGNQPSGFLYFVDNFMAQVYLLIHEEQFRCVCQELQECLHPTIETHVGDWILYKDYTVIRVYGSKINPYKLPTFLTLRIFPL